jgi:hypothetical protein
MNKLNEKDALRPSGEFATLLMTPCDDTQKHTTNIRKGYVDNASLTTKQDVNPSDLVIAASSEV